MPLVTRWLMQFQARDRPFLFIMLFFISDITINDGLIFYFFLTVANKSNISLLQEYETMYCDTLLPHLLPLDKLICRSLCHFCLVSICVRLVESGGNYRSSSSGWVSWESFVSHKQTPAEQEGSGDSCNHGKEVLFFPFSFPLVR